MPNPKTGRSSQMGPGYAMWNWAFHNPEEAFPLWKEWYFDTHPDKPEPTFQDFLYVIKKVSTNNPSVASQRRLVRFCNKYGLEMDYKVNPKDVVQVKNRIHPLYQALLIVDRVEKTNVYGFIVNSDGSRSEHRLSVKEVAVIGEAIDARNDGVFTVSNLTNIPKLEHFAHKSGTPLKRIEFVGDGVRFVYVVYLIYVLEEDRVEEKIVSYFYKDVEEGIEEEVSRLKGKKSFCTP